jgi:CTP:molybdopterin cytidylyltransferase MocA
LKRRVESIAAVILAAGASIRMGSPKPLVRLLDGRTFLGAIAAALREGGITGTIFVVTGSSRASVSKEAKRLGLTPVHNAQHSDGQLSSALTGLRAARRAGAMPLLLLPCDMPHLAPSTVAQLLSVDPPALPVQGGRTGHPIYLNASAVHALLKPTVAKTLREALHVAGVRPHRVPVADRTILENVNTPAQLGRSERA